jgi:hypothetical protein
MRILIILLTIGTGPALRGQGLLDSLATEVCRCMTDRDELVYPRLQADRCVQTVGLAYEVQIRDTFYLSVLDAADRRRLSELLIYPLSRDCPALANLDPGRVEPSFRYSDLNLATPPRPAALKQPPALPLTPVLGEGAEEWTVAATYVGTAGRERVVLRLADGRDVTFAAPPRLLRRAGWRKGETVRVTYRLDWRAATDRAVPTITAAQ